MFNGKALREKMKYYGYESDDLGPKVGVTGRSIELYIIGKVCPAADTVEKLAIVFDLDISYFFNGIDRESGIPLKGSSHENTVQ